jgi:hypothetical protein
MKLPRVLTLTAALLLAAPAFSALPNVDASGNALPSLAPMYRDLHQKGSE